MPAPPSPPIEKHLHATPAGPPRFPFGALTTVGLPAGAANANWFGFFNAINWGIMLGAPVILYAKSLGASSLVLGTLASLLSLTTFLQLPGAHLLPWLGYRRLMLACWTSRTLFVFVLAAVPLLPVARSSKLSLVVGCMLMFTTLRSFAGGMYMPWMSELIPETIRGHFFSRDQFFGQAGNLVALLSAAVAMHGHTQPWQFSVAFLVSAVGGVVSLRAIQRIPEVASPEQMKRSGARVPWTAMLLFRPFFRLIVFNVLFSVFVGGLGVFSVAYLRGSEGYTEGAIILLATLSVFGALATLPWSGPLMDRVGSRPVFIACAVAFMLILAGWFAVAAGLLNDGIVVIGTLYFLSGVFGVNFTVANARAQAATVPLMGRNHFFALFTVLTSLAAGTSPIAWGAVLDLIGEFKAATGPVAWNRYSIYFAAASVLSLAALTYTRWLEEAPIASREPGPAVRISPARQAT